MINTFAKDSLIGKRTNIEFNTNSMPSLKRITPDQFNHTVSGKQPMSSEADLKK